MTYVRFKPGWKTETAKRNDQNDFNTAVDIIEAENIFTITLDLPGLVKNDINISVNEGVLTVSGERKGTEAGDEKYFHYIERHGGKFSRSFRLPELVDADTIKASYKNGVLSLELVKKEEAKPRTIEIK